MRNGSRRARIVPIHVGDQGVHDLGTAFPRHSHWPSPGRIAAVGCLLLVAVLSAATLWRSARNLVPLTDKQISSRLASSDLAEVDRSLLQVGERVRLHRPAQHWYPDVVRLASSSDEKVRARAAWVMGLDNTREDFHARLISMLNDPARDVRGATGVSLASFGDRAGHAQIVEALRPLQIVSPHSGEVASTRRYNEVRVGGVVATLQNGNEKFEVKSPIAGVLGKVSVRAGDTVSAGVPIAFVYPTPEHAWDALHALELIGDWGDLEVVKLYQGDVPVMPQNVVDESFAAEKAIRKRSVEAK